MTRNSHTAFDAVRLVWADFRRCWRTLVAFEAGFKLLQLWFFAPAFALALAIVMARADRVVVNDWDILDFLLSPVGIVYAFLLGVCSSGFLLFEQAVVIALAAQCDSKSQQQRHLWKGAMTLAWKATKIGAIKCVVAAAVFAPLALVVGLTYLLCLSSQDINYYLSERPTAFWMAGGIGVVVLLSAACRAIVLAVRWAFAIPILIYEHAPVQSVLQESRARVTGMAVSMGVSLVGWQLCMLVGGLGVNAAFSRGPAMLPEWASGHPHVLVVLLIARGMLLGVLSFVGSVGYALLIRRLYLMSCESHGLPTASASPLEWDDGIGTIESFYAMMPRMEVISVVAILALPIVVWSSLSIGMENRPDVQVTAHRGHERVAPENTLSAVQAAIEIGADYAEIDVQLTSDGKVVLLHDRDLKRVTGDPRRIDAITFAVLQTLDAGGWFSPRFAGERVPTLEQVIDASRGRIKLNIELKSYGPDRQLARAVARVIAEKGFEADCIVTSFSQGALRDVKAENPRIRTGLILVAALGDVTKLETEILSIQVDQLSDRLLRRARARGLEIHVWGGNSEEQMVRQILRGVDNIITSDPELLIRVRDRLTGLTNDQRLVVASQALLKMK